MAVNLLLIILQKAIQLQRREHCLKMYVNGVGFRAIARITGINHNTIIRWVKKVARATISSESSRNPRNY